MKIRHILSVLAFITLGYLGYSLYSSSNHNIEVITHNNIIQVQTDFRPEIQDVLDEYEQFYKRRFKECGSVGGALAVVYKGQVVHIKGYGLKKIGTKDSVDVNTVFRLASVSKGFAGVLSSILHKKELLNLDTPCVAYLPDFKLQRQHNTNTVTLRHTLSHTSGLTAYSFDTDVESGASYNSLYRQLHIANVQCAPGTTFAYQNVIFSLIDTVARKHLHKTYGELLHEYVFTPLGMNNASTSFEGFKASENFAYPHKGYAKGTAAVKLNNRYYQTAPAAGVNASISDMSKWLQALLGYAPSVIAPSVVSDISTPLVQMPVKAATNQVWGNLSNKAYGMGWRIFTSHGNKIVYHGGFVEGYRAEIAFCPEKEIGIVFLQNSANTLALEAVPTFMNMFFKHEELLAQK
ncbi:MAG: beta-lactamase family protein [Bacteroidales bacterium]|jgi:beta-lactamase class C|nr:beta-lactamase family protein [Bacteroidales bacterium]